MERWERRSATTSSRSLYRNETLSRAFRLAALLFTALALAMVYWATRLRWTKPADFDIVGFLWLFQNAGRISAIVFAAIFGGMAIYCWIRAALAR